MEIIDKNVLISSNQKSITVESKVGVLLNRTKSLFSVLYSCYKNGVTYIPFDVNWPSEKINSIISDIKLNDVITNNEYYDKVKITNPILINDSDDIINVNCNANNDISYILYTSGSTGEPKGVEITRDSLNNFIEGISEAIDFSSGKRIACLTTVSFDIFFLESIMALEKGLTIILANEDEQRNPKLMARLIKDNNVDMLQMTPSRMQLLLNHDKELSCLENVKEIMIGGESFPLSLLKALQTKTTAKIYNMYGPTETTIWSTLSDLTNKDYIDIGVPIKNTEVYIVDENLCIVSTGEIGEICISGKGLAKGYTGRNDQTSEKFIYLPQKPDTKIYKTGDVGKYLVNGNLAYIGRIDNQVKIRGHRIELEEIETYMNRIDGIKQSVVIALEASETDKILEAFYTSDEYIDPKNIVDCLSLNLPSDMIPAIFKRVENFIHMANGKIDRKKVLDCIEINSDAPAPQEKLSNGINDIQKKIFDVIITSLDEKISNDICIDTEFSSGKIDSITFIKIVVALESEFEFEFDDEMLLITKFPTIMSMIEYVESKVIEDNVDS